MMYSLLSILAQADGGEVRLTGAGALLMTLSIVLVVGLLVFCMARILRETRPEEHHHVPLEIDTEDTNG